jgi:hypothetical protein
LFHGASSEPARDAYSATVKVSELARARRVVGLRRKKSHRAPARAAGRGGGYRNSRFASVAVTHRARGLKLDWRWEGRLSGYKPGRAPLVRESELLAFVETNETTKWARGHELAGPMAD